MQYPKRFSLVTILLICNCLEIAYSANGKLQFHSVEKEYQSDVSLDFQCYVCFPDGGNLQQCKEPSLSQLAPCPPRPDGSHVCWMTMREDADKSKPLLEFSSEDMSSITFMTRFFFSSLRFNRYPRLW